MCLLTDMVEKMISSKCVGGLSEVEDTDIQEECIGWCCENLKCKRHQKQKDLELRL